MVCLCDDSSAKMKARFDPVLAPCDFCRPLEFSLQNVKGTEHLQSDRLGGEIYGVGVISLGCQRGRHTGSSPRGWVVLPVTNGLQEWHLAL